MPRGYQRCDSVKWYVLAVKARGETHSSASWTEALQSPSKGLLYKQTAQHLPALHSMQGMCRRGMATDEVLSCEIFSSRVSLDSRALARSSLSRLGSRQGSSAATSAEAGCAHVISAQGEGRIECKSCMSCLPESSVCTNRRHVSSIGDPDMLGQKDWLSQESKST